jgi:hypothetical protein
MRGFYNPFVFSSEGRDQRLRDLREKGTISSSDNADYVTKKTLGVTNSYEKSPQYNLSEK